MTEISGSVASHLCKRACAKEFPQNVENDAGVVIDFLSAKSIYAASQ